MNRPGGGGVGGLARRLRVAVGLAWGAKRSALVGMAFVMVLHGVLPVAAAWLTKLLLDDLVEPGAGNAAWALGGLATAALVAAVVPLVSRYLSAQLRRSLELLVQTRLFAAVNRFQELAPFERPSFHDRLRLAEEAGQSAPAQVVSSSASSVQSAITLAGFMGSLVLIDARLAALAAASSIPSLVAQLRLSRSRAALAWRLSPKRRRAMHYSMFLSDAEAAKEIRLFGIGDFLLGRMTALIRGANADEQRLDRRDLRVQGILGLAGALAVAAGIAVVVSSALAGDLGVGDVSVALAALASVQPGLAGLVAQAAAIHNGLLMFAHYQGLVDDAAAQPRGTGDVLAPLRQGVRVRDLWFRYDDDHPWALAGVDLDIPHGSTLALVGPNGAGKTTLVKLLCRFYDPVRGAITWDGRDLTSIPHAALRARISAVFQDFVAYDLTAAENVAVGALEHVDDRERIRRAADRAGVDAALLALPRGYDTMLSRVFIQGDGDGDAETGVLLSGGQWQRLAVARALLRDGADLLVMDEPSSGLDAEAEYRLASELRALRRGRTTLVISHRLSTARQADRIAVLDGGRVVESGTHDELMARAGRYAELFRLQAEGYVGGAGDPLAAEPAEPRRSP